MQCWNTRLTLGDRPERDRKKTRNNKLPEDSSSDETLWCGERKRRRRKDGVMEKRRIRMKNCVKCQLNLGFFLPRLNQSNKERVI